MQHDLTPNPNIRNMKKRSGRPKVSILLVEDSPTQAEKLRHILRQQKYEVSVAGNGREAIIKMQDHKPDMVISDVLMPEMDGYDFCRHVKTNPKLKDTPVILLTSLSDPKDVLKGLECGANSFIVKPYEAAYLISRIQYVLANEEIRRKESFRVGIEIYFAGQKYFITSDRIQILDLLLSTYESAVLRNTELAQVQEELRKLNESLEVKVRDRTEALRKSEEQYRLLFESNPLPMWVYDEETLSILAVNDAAVGHYGYSRNEFIQMTIKDLRPPEEIEALVDFVSVPRHEFSKAGIWRHRKKDGSIIVVEITSHEIVWQGKQARFVLANDITERKQAETLQSALYRIAEKTSSAEDMQEFYTAIHSIVGELMYAKNFYIALYDDSKQKVAFPYFVDEVDTCSHPEQSIGGLTGHVLRTGQPLLVSEEAFIKMVELGELQLIGAPSAYWLGVPLKAGEKVFGVLAVQSYSKSITFGEREKELLTFVSQHIATAIERKRQQGIKLMLEEQLLQAQKMEAVGRLAGGVAHDFNNILMAITAYSELLLMQMDRNDPLRRNALEIEKAAEQGAKLTRQLLAFSRKQILSPQVIDLNHSMAQIENMLQRLVGEDVELSTVLSKDLGFVKADPGQMEQVIMNLAVNARDAMPKGGKLTIETANVELDNAYASTHAGVKPGPHVMLAINDNGGGMDEATLSKIFEPFFTTKEEGKGTGLGLSTVYGIVQQSGGHIWVYSELGYGTTFKIYFPRVDKEAGTQTTPISSTDLSGQGQVILLVDDNEPIRMSVGDYLEKKGYRVLQANNGKKAAEISHNHDGPIHMIITDMVMPEMSGWELVEIVRTERPQIKVILMSGYTDEGVKQHAFMNSNAAFLQKPASMEGLLRKIRELLLGP